ncbi:MAG: TonB family protein [Alphaproteobacteria bacterium]|nr:TonB family protein [Alphaproteobacteria bacterium]
MVWEKAADIIDLNASRQKLAAGETAGAFLANARRAAGFSHANVAEATKIKPRHLEAIEACDAPALPALPYAVGFVKVYARFLGLDAEAITAQFKSDIAPPEILTAPAELSQAADDDAGVHLVSIAAIVVILMFVAWIAYEVAGGRQPDDVIAAAPTPWSQPVRLQASASPAAEPSLEEPPQPVVADSDGQTEAILAPKPAASDAAPLNRVVADPVVPDLSTDATPVDVSPVEETPNLLDAVMADIEAPEITLNEPQDAPLSDAPAAPSVRVPVIVEPKLIRSKAPRYPARCERRAAELETVTVFFDVTPEGRTANARAGVSTNACFNEAALRAISKWRFEPETTNGAARLSTNRRATLNFQR